MTGLKGGIRSRVSGMKYGTCFCTDSFGSTIFPQLSRLSRSMHLILWNSVVFSTYDLCSCVYCSLPAIEELSHLISLGHCPKTKLYIVQTAAAIIKYRPGSAVVAQQTSTSDSAMISVGPGFNPLSGFTRMIVSRRARRWSHPFWSVVLYVSETVSTPCIDLELEECICYKYGARAQVPDHLRNERSGWLFAVLADTRPYQPRLVFTSISSLRAVISSHSYNAICLRTR
jgi:hypothetical protein